MPISTSQLSLASALLAVSLSACGGSEATDSEGILTGAPGPAIPESYWSEIDHPGALAIAGARKSAPEGQELVLVGRVKDFVDGRAVFTLIDSALDPCNIDGDESCPTPWDYCCIESNVQVENTVTVELLGNNSRPLRTGVQGFHGLDHLDMVTVRGTPARDVSGNLTLSLVTLHRR